MGRAVEDRETVIREVLIPAELAASRAPRPAKRLKEATRLLFVAPARQANFAPAFPPDAQTSVRWAAAANGAGILFINSDLFALEWQEISIFPGKTTGMKGCLVCSVRISMFVKGCPHALSKRG